ncbi:hypothetical protein SteCoe_4938 [Stentor coeruleus]|uniref:Mitochondrial import inner membrane translocase subunit TIM50 n=1 Tax=Stentor coeruleus TaxID=5963 RepID=A0A1R2CTG8_9CILI|nr:hypothetical protein SteCoe_4938 [Stentor coeruleus]
MSFRRIYKNSLSPGGKFKNRFTSPARLIEKDFLPRISSAPKNASSIEKTYTLETKESPFMINLEDLIIIEQNLSQILDKFNNPNSVLPACEEVYEMTAENTLNQVSLLYRDERTRDAIRYSMVLQAVGISLTHYFISEYSLNHEMALLIKSIIFSIHQGFLILTKFVLSRVPSDNTNTWALKLRQIIKEKKLRKHNIDNTTFLDHYNQLIVNNMKKMCRNFISRTDDPTARCLKLSVLQIIRHKGITISESRSLIEKAFGVKRENSEKLENTLKSPFLPETPNKIYTLVLDLDETLVHYIDTENRGKYLIRPYVNEFLQALEKNFEIVIFTAAIQDYADWILDDLDKNKLITYRLYRHHTVPAGNYFLKDLKKLGRDLSKVIIVDNVAENFQLQRENGILIKSWYEDTNDTALKELQDFLLAIPRNQIQDVRAYLKSTREKMLNGIDC